MNFLLFNPLANNNQGEISKDEAISALKDFLGDFSDKSIIDLDFVNFFKTECDADSKVVLLGGDGTINNFANAVYGYDLPCNVYIYKAGTGNDFLNDVVDKIDENNLLLLNPYIKRLPKIYVNGIEKRYINGIGYGIDGQCCVVAEAQKKTGKTNISYAGISIKLCIHGYKCPDAEVIVDGESKKYHKVWLASGMNGRYYGGGMKIAPDQDRLSDELSVSLIYGSSKLATLIVFPKIFKGEHVKSKHSEIRKGKDITVKFSRPTALQIDGEVVENVTEYRIVKD